MAESSFTVDIGDPPPYVVVQYLECYSAPLDGRRSVVKNLAGDANEIHDERTWCMRYTVVCV